MHLYALHRVAPPGLLALVLTSCTVVGYPSGHGSTGAMPAREPPSSSSSSGSVRVAGTMPENPRSDAGRSYEVFGVRYRVLDSAEGYRETGEASWYGQQFHGRPTSSGEVFDMHGFSAAHRTLPLHTWVEVTNLQNGRRLVIRVNDRGPFAHTERRILDLSYGAARELDVVAAGVVPVQVRALSPAEVERLR